jgi:hypothetical protein
MTVPTPDVDETDELIAEKLLTLTLRREHGNTPIGILRKTYGCNFALHCSDDEQLRSVLQLDAASLTGLIRYHKAGKLRQICSG